MAERQVDNVDVVPHAGAVGRVIVVAVDINMVELADCDLSNIGHEICGDAFGVLADPAALVRADGVEVAQQADAPFVIRRIDIF